MLELENDWIYFVRDSSGCTVASSFLATPFSIKKLVKPWCLSHKWSVSLLKSFHASEDNKFFSGNMSLKDDPVGCTDKFDWV